MEYLKNQDQEVVDILNRELERIRGGVELIPSENFVSRAVMEAMGTIMTNKYSEGYPGKRYYGGNEHVDEVENLAIERAKQLFGAEHVNVQPYSGSPANMAVFFALMNPGDTFMGLDLNAGGHLTHGSAVNFSGRLFKCEPYNVRPDTGYLDMDEIREQAKRIRPKMILSGLTAYPREIDFKAFQKIADEVGAYHFADISHIAGLIAGSVHQSPVPHCDVVTTTTHKTLRGPRGAIIMSKLEDKYHDKLRPDEKKNLAQLIDFHVFPGMQGGPHDHITTAKAVAFKEALKPSFKNYAQQIVKNAKRLSEELMSRDIALTSNGTDNHLMVIDLTKSDLTGQGKDIQDALDVVGIFTNKNTVPYEPASPFKPSGIRIGTPAITTRGLIEDDMVVIADGIAKIIKNHKSESVRGDVKKSITELCDKYPLYPKLKY
ncbi:MAG: serine hydroxymethyltransferase [Candidatus Buchananbacteria bacterium CG10_big_fil_rev_8_21_14_0_10_42_9]|uniref:Serine hydroxymethyltransferase n=1 Tax=Candidatus Buchananbacteria bacterium CG10_big_fil_rev_8_21_14_0_10_42_9 TaxID=1974526 RepID=A0A2H0W1G1_9BACT|nr:MAG: serine hydroxymethyltransferase [Candidatus Buchananbacteria bacterium CG10_big_fil_rev_8_21_14_0_10_42_9]